ncbi:MAG TPA: hypothetical protein ACFYED_01515 [Candidatus Tripitaka californicus]|uniref:hypothetical protein n=1 Tax=Candidatus Tripitaka californicus TaxID=3367616 RepID=UPI0040255B85
MAFGGLGRKGLEKELCGKVTDKFLELLLHGMDWAFRLLEDYRKNIEGFKGRYLFRTAGGDVAVAATFKDGDMEVNEEPTEDYEWNVRIKFKDYAALRDFLFSKDQDILNSLLKNEVEMDGNVSYIYKFGFMARDLSRRLGVG